MKQADLFSSRSHQEAITRYSRRVSYAKYAFLVVALLLVGLVVMIPAINPTHKQFELSYSTDGGSGAGLEPKMLNPHLQGIDNQGKPYSLKADDAEQISEKLVVLHNLNGELALKNEEWMLLVADKAEVDMKENSILLTGAVNLFTAKSYQLKTNIAYVDIASTFAYGNEPVVMQGPMGKLDATGFEISDNGQMLNFKGRVKLVILPDIIQKSQSEGM